MHRGEKNERKEKKKKKKERKSLIILDIGWKIILVLLSAASKGNSSPLLSAATTGNSGPREMYINFQLAMMAVVNQPINRRKNNIKGDTTYPNQRASPFAYQVWFRIYRASLKSKSMSFYVVVENS
ncbi:hypothetical protein EPI10_025457 [Gossypium australe]|uniref:Uncharacterized protein n=1 Tax=Gossypium australe TaxID=47621 RepID=A0A5B6W2A9_9ROSI|nr:hypothetical protein EPI10_025457 [Gossypium australe]